MKCRDCHEPLPDGSPLCGPCLESAERAAPAETSAAEWAAWDQARASFLLSAADGRPDA